MEEVCRVFLIGDSLFTESLAQMLSAVETVCVVNTAVSQPVETAVAQTQPHIIIIADTGQHKDISTTLLSQFPDIPIINADLNRDYVQVITSRRVGTKRTDLLAAIHDLSKQIRE
jgi:ABC-type Fe3+-citrate transport system substrate-binding protein